MKLLVTDIGVKVAEADDLSSPEVHPASGLTDQKIADALMEVELGIIVRGHAFLNLNRLAALAIVGGRQTWEPVFRAAIDRARSKGWVDVQSGRGLVRLVRNGVKMIATIKSK